ncbi:MAG: efflux RND transporter periplasmic adaptor subunit [Acidobacteriota bacterium]
MADLRRFLRILPAALVLWALLLGVACARGQNEGAASYHCPMHPQVISDRPGDCPICGMRLVPVEKPPSPPPAGPTPTPPETTPPAPSAPAKKILYRSTMNPGEVSDHPGKDSMGMEMVPFEAEGPAPTAVPGRAPVTVPAERLQHLNLTVGKVSKKKLFRQVRTSARITADETRLFRVTTKLSGWVDRLYVNVTGQAVRKGQPLLDIYSPELVASQQELLSALAASEQLGKSPYEPVSRGGMDLLKAARRRLKLWDITDEQIARIETTGQVEKNVTLYAPAGGYVVEKNVLPGQKIMPGDSLLVIADLSEVWAEADVYESDLPYVQVGMPVTLTLPYWPGRTFQGRVSFLNPYLDPRTRTLVARLDLPNRDLLLKPEMYGDALLSYDLGERLAIPESAVLRTARKAFAFKVEKDGSLSPTEIETGERSGDDFVLLSGLQEGDSVVTSANFLIDSESSLKAALQAVAGP